MKQEQQTGQGKQSPGKAIAAVSVGNALEWYDFSVFAFFAVYRMEISRRLLGVDRTKGKRAGIHEHCI